MSKARIGRLVPFVVVAGLTLIAGPAPAQYVWKSTTSSNWNNAANWTGGIPVSGATTTLTFGAGTYTATDDITTSPFQLTGLTFGASGTATLADSGQGLDFVGATPTITMGAGNGTITQAVTLGANTTIGGGTGTLTLAGAVNDGGQNFGLIKSSAGSLVLTGGGSFLQLSAQAGSTTITGGTLALTMPDPFNGTARLSGLQVGNAAGQTASVLINGGATVNVTENIFVGDILGSTGTVTVDGPGTTVNCTIGGASGRLAVGNDGTGTLNITNGAAVTCSFLFAPRTGSITGIPTFTPTNTSTINVSGPGSTLNVGTEASFCSNALGNATFSNGATLNATGAEGMVMGVNSLGFGSVTFTGLGTTANVSQLVVAYSTPINPVTCTLNILNGASMTVTDTVFIGLGFAGGAEGGTLPSNGVVNVSGAGSLLSVPDPGNNSTALVVGGGSGNGTGTLNITSGGAVSASFLELGANPGATGFVTLTGAKSSLTVTGETDVSPGVAGSILTANLGTVVNLGPTFVWAGGTINVNTGTLGSFRVNGLADGYSPPSTGSVIIAAGSTLIISPDGNNDGGPGAPSFSGIISGAGGVTKTGPGMQIFTGGTNTFTGPMSINGGVLNFGVLADLGLGTAINFGGGTLQYATGNTADISARTVTINFGGATIDTNGNNVTFGSAIGNSGNGGLTKIGLGTLTLAGTNTYTGGTNVVNGTLSISGDANLGSGNVTGAAAATLAITGTTSTTKSFAMGGGMISVAAAQTVTFTGGQISGTVLNGPGTFVTDPTAGAVFIGSSSRPSAAVTSNSANDQFVNFTNGGPMTVAANINTTGAITTVNLNGFTNQGSGTLTIGGATNLHFADFQSSGTLTLSPAVVGSHLSTLMTNGGTSPMYFNGGSETFIGTAATVGPSNNPNFVAGIDLHGSNAIVQGGLFVNNGYVVDSSTAGTATVVADFGALVQGAGFFQNTVITQNGGKFKAGNCPGETSFGNFVMGPGGVNNDIFYINNATGTAGPVADAAGNVSGWSLVKTVKQAVGTTTTSGDFTWTATPSNPMLVALDTLVNPSPVGVDVVGPMANFDPTKAYSWLAGQWTGTYSGPTDPAALDAATAFNTSAFVNQIEGSFGWSLDLPDDKLFLTYTPSPVPEPSTLALVGATGLVAGWWRRRKSAVAKVS